MAGGIIMKMDGGELFLSANRKLSANMGGKTRFWDEAVLVSEIVKRNPAMLAGVEYLHSKFADPDKNQMYSYSVKKVVAQAMERGKDLSDERIFWGTLVGEMSRALAGRILNEIAAEHTTIMTLLAFDAGRQIYARREGIGLALGSDGAIRANTTTVVYRFRYDMAPAYGKESAYVAIAKGPEEACGVVHHYLGNLHAKKANAAKEGNDSITAASSLGAAEQSYRMATLFDEKNAEATRSLVIWYESQGQKANAAEQYVRLAALEHDLDLRASHCISAAENAKNSGDAGVMIRTLREIETLHSERKSYRIEFAIATIKDAILDNLME